MDIEYTQKAIIRIDELNWKTYELPEDPLSEKNRDKIKYDRNLAEWLLKESGCRDVEIDLELERADKHQEDNWKAYSIWSFIYTRGELRLNSILNDALSLQYEEVFSGFTTIHGWTSKAHSIQIYRDPNTKGIVKLSNASGKVPTMQVEATPEIDLEGTIKNMKDYTNANWKSSASNH